MSEAIITAEGLRKHYGRVAAVDGLDLEVRRGEIYGFLGRNGAGKTTTIRILLGLIRPTSGRVSVLGHTLGTGGQAWLRQVGFLVESASAYPNLTVLENLDLQRRLTGAPASAVGEVVERLALGPYADRRAGRLSLGNKQRLSLARALLHQPELLVLDEPANALDPAGIVEVRDLLRELSREHGVTVFMSSHILAEVAHLADRVGIVADGRLVEEAPRDELAARARDFVRDSFTAAEREEALLTDDLERYFLARTGGGR
ncbi:MAG: ABC transporter ATP-binding protein [Actinobacteria bacterium]|nr:ABC transporter ATP-binding protein [Actinomycetota bacterium]